MVSIMGFVRANVKADTEAKGRLDEHNARSHGVLFQQNGDETMKIRDRAQ